MSASEPEGEGEARCPTCRKPTWACVCDRVRLLEVRTRVVILQHPQEDDVVLGTARIVTSAIPSARILVGLSWPSLEAALEEEVDRSKWASVWAHKLPPELEGRKGAVVMDRHGAATTERPEGIVLLDGTWSQAKTLWWRNPWLLKLGRVALRPAQPSIYGKLRREPRREHVSTLEATGAALTGLGEDPAVEAELGRLMRTMVQRARDHGYDARATAPAPRKPGPARDG
ncbi:MAG: tRNA-uridine aminocarboxypropyltransferase [Sandaracinus sp.]